MKLLLDTLVIFFGILAAAGLLALGEPLDDAAPALAPATTLAASVAAPR